MNVLSELRRIMEKISLAYGLYEARYKNYTKLIKTFLNIYLRSKQNILCLDLGCGDGFFTKILSMYCDKAVGIDLRAHNSWMISQRENNNFLIADARRIPIRSVSADLVLIISLLEHVPNWRYVISEVSRILKMGGLIIIKLPNLHSIFEPHTKLPLISLMPSKVKDLITDLAVHDKLEWDCTVENIISILEKYGLKIIGVIPYSYTNTLRIIPNQAYYIIAIKTYRNNRP
jgi:ubiquinone/menaquinone biosynthesis C-methylase UbiE